MATGEKAPGAFKTIGELSSELGVAQHILRYWESKFPQLRPLQRAGNRRYYRPADVELARTIHRLLNSEGYTVRGVQKVLRAQGCATCRSRHDRRRRCSGRRRPAGDCGRGNGIDVERLKAVRSHLARPDRRLEFARLHEAADDSPIPAPRRANRSTSKLISASAAVGNLLAASSRRSCGPFASTSTSSCIPGLCPTTIRRLASPGRSDKFDERLGLGEVDGLLLDLSNVSPKPSSTRASVSVVRAEGLSERPGRGRGPAPHLLAHGLGRLPPAPVQRPVEVPERRIAPVRFGMPQNVERSHSTVSGWISGDTVAAAATCAIASSSGTRRIGTPAGKPTAAATALRRTI